eukprot:361719-Chlamydomonas_euryale.AAC.5
MLPAGAGPHTTVCNIRAAAVVAAVTGRSRGISSGLSKCRHTLFSGECRTQGRCIGHPPPQRRQQRAALAAARLGRQLRLQLLKRRRQRRNAAVSALQAAEASRPSSRKAMRLMASAAADDRTPDAKEVAASAPVCCATWPVASKRGTVRVPSLPPPLPPASWDAHADTPLAPLPPSQPSTDQDAACITGAWGSGAPVSIAAAASLRARRSSSSSRSNRSTPPSACLRRVPAAAAAAPACGV